MRKKIEYVSEMLVKEEIKVFKRTAIPDLEAKIGEEYKQYFSESLLHSVSTAVWASLYVSLYLTSSDFKRKAPSFSQQMCAIYDYTNLLRKTEAPLRFFEKTNYWPCYSKISSLVHEKERFQKTHEISEEFWIEIGIAHKENLRPEHIELFLCFVEKMTRALTEATLSMVSAQIQNIFPGQSERYRQSLDGVYGSSIHEHIAVAGDDETHRTTKKIGFSL